MPIVSNLDDSDLKRIEEMKKWMVEQNKKGIVENKKKKVIVYNPYACCAWVIEKLHLDAVDINPESLLHIIEDELKWLKKRKKNTK